MAKLADVEGRARQDVADTQAKYEEAKTDIERKYAEGKITASKMTNDVKAGWFDWWRWGSAKADETKRSGADKAVKVSEEVGKHSSA